jgi:4-amino-4-deoxy-L-arabinose transferase-like glycosyltransferase
MNSVKLERKLLICWLFIVMLPLFFIRFYQDEGLYLNMAIRFGEKLLPRPPLALVLIHPFSLLDSYQLFVWSSRFVTSLFTLFNLLLIYRIVKERYGERAALVSSLIFLFSFVTLRYGARYTLEPYPLFFILLSIYLIERNVLASSFSAGLSFAARSTALVYVPFYVLYTLKQQKSSIALTALIPVILTVLWIWYVKSIVGGLSPVEYNYVSQLAKHDISWIVTRSVRGWAEFAIAYPLAFFGFLYSLRSERNKDIFILTLPMILALSGVYGFLLNGAFERYTMIPLALMCITAGKPIADFMDKHGLKMRHLVAFLIAHLLVLNAGVLLISETGANSIYDFGFWYDVEVVNILNEKASNEFVVGTPHGAFVNAEWKYAERRISEAIALDPDWLVTFRAWVEVKPNDRLEVYEIGPYILIHSHPRGYIKEYVEPTNFGFNKLRK